MQDLLPQHLHAQVGHHVAPAWRVDGLQIGCTRGQSDDGLLPGCPNNCMLICADLSCDQVLHTCNISHGYRPVKTQGLLSKRAVMQPEPLNGYKRFNKSEAVQVITEVATVRICASLRPLNFCKFLATVCTKVSSACPNHRAKRRFWCC